MRKFIMRAARDGAMSIMEVEIELVQAAEDQSVMWLPEGEYKARVMAPVELYEKQEDGSLTPPIWHSHAFYWNEHQAGVYVERAIRGSLERQKLHYGTEYTEDDIKQKMSEVQVIRLP